MDGRVCIVVAIVCLTGCVHVPSSAAPAVGQRDRLADVVVEGSPENMTGWTSTIQPWLFEAIGHPVDPLALRKVMAEMTESYRAAGYTHASIAAELEPIRPGLVRARITYRQGRYVASLGFVGARAFTEPALLQVFGVSVGDPYSRPVFAYALEVLARHYFDHGMIRTLITPEESSTDDAVTLKCVVAEGVVFRVGVLTFGGRELGSESEARAAMATQTGMVFSVSRMGADIEVLKARAASRGVDVEVAVTTIVNEDARTVDLTVVIERKAE